MQIGSAVARPIFHRIGLPWVCLAANLIVATGPTSCLFIGTFQATKVTLSLFTLVVFVRSLSGNAYQSECHQSYD